MSPRKVCVTGVGLVSPAGCTAEEVWSCLSAEEPWNATSDGGRFAPYVYHPERPYDPTTHLKSKAQVRAMGRSQLNGVHAAALALDAAGLKKRAAVLARTDLLVACGAGDNDPEVDDAVLQGAGEQTPLDGFLNRQLMSARPSLYLNQLPNLFAGNIALSLGVTGASLTFIGDEVAGMNALHTAYQRIRAGQSDIALAGGVSEGGRRHYLESYMAREQLVEGPFVEIWERADDRMCFGNAAAFLVLEAEDHARSRGATVMCALTGLGLTHAPRTKRSATSQTEEILQTMDDRRGADGRSADHQEALPVLTASNLTRAMLADELMFWSAGGRPYQNACNVFGGMLEASFPVAVALTALSIQRGSSIPPLSSRRTQVVERGRIRGGVAACWGRTRGEAVARLEA